MREPPRIACSVLRRRRNCDWGPVGLPVAPARDRWQRRALSGSTDGDRPLAPATAGTKKHGPLRGRVQLLRSPERSELLGVLQVERTTDVEAAVAREVAA